MKDESKYRIALLDEDQFEISHCHAENLKDAKTKAKYMLTDEWARNGESTHENLGTCKVEIRDKDGEVIADFFHHAYEDSE